MFKELEKRLKTEFSGAHALGDSTIASCKTSLVSGISGLKINVFLSATDLGSKVIDKTVIERHLKKSYEYGLENGDLGRTRVLKSNFATITFLCSDNITTEAKEYCRKLRTNINSNASFQIPVLVDRKTRSSILFENKPIVGALVHPQLKKMIKSLLV